LLYEEKQEMGDVISHTALRERFIQDLQALEKQYHDLWSGAGNVEARGDATELLVQSSIVIP
jgi:hypothetical protein